MSVLDLLAEGRAAAEAIMLDACTITRVTGPEGEMDPETGLRDPAPTETIYPLPGAVAPLDGRCKVQTYEPHESTKESGDHVFTEQRYHLHLPIGAGPIAVNDTATITEAAADAGLVARSYRIAGLHHKSLATAQRLLVDEITD
jgi:hypothetical protein